jgi:COP9 signalosome complex subunit 4
VPEIEGVQSQTAKLSAYGSLLDSIYSSAPSALTDNLKAFVDAILAESVSLVITRPALVDFVARLDSVKDIETKKQVLIFALDKVHPRAVSFEEQAASIREKLADIYEEEGDHNAAYRALTGITLDSGQRSSISAAITLTTTEQFRRITSLAYMFGL